MDVQDSRKDALPGSRFTPVEGRVVTNWNDLVGEVVQIWRFNQVVDEGQVESVTYDGTVLWLAQSGPIERRLVEKERGTGLRIRIVG